MKADARSTSSAGTAIAAGGCDCSPAVRTECSVPSPSTATYEGSCSPSTAIPTVRNMIASAVSVVCARATTRSWNHASPKRCAGSSSHPRRSARWKFRSPLAGIAPPKVSTTPRPGPLSTTPPLAAASTTRRENMVGLSATELTLRFT